MLGYWAGKEGGREPIEEVTAVIQVGEENVQTNAVAKEQKSSAVES